MRRAGGFRVLGRVVAVLLLVVVATFLAASGMDHCDEGPAGHDRRPQHLLCVDDCAPALVPLPPTAPPPDAVPRAVYEETVVRPILNLDLEPEKAPPRA
ncbi:hypothetical protein [Mesoterricola silvestris]|uniref:Uncharacterized protein n=1 Tax=Mesoterricola silvestris TaxID=2927979 RepID=A0AA48GQA2_9BACT|nr:hypothetical protein [Mesoterricola silvestris]BDU72032.1 hypothetical protein METEAL_12060 [Mesoterricola silvestris]